MAEKTNIILIGMCGVGKSTIGVLLAKALSMDFVDTDLVIQSAESTSLQQILDEKGIDQFCELECQYVLSLNLTRTVIATGGSVVYRKPAMDYLAANGIVVHLDLDYDNIEKRVDNLQSRGVVMHRDQSLRSLYQKRQPIYRCYADITISCADKNHDSIVTEVIEKVLPQLYY